MSRPPISRPMHPAGFHPADPTWRPHAPAEVRAALRLVSDCLDLYTVCPMKNCTRTGRCRGGDWRADDPRLPEAIADNMRWRGLPFCLACDWDAIGPTILGHLDTLRRENRQV